MNEDYERRLRGITRRYYLEDRVAKMDRIEKSLSAVTREGYELWRGTHPADQFAPCSWDDLTERQRMGYMAVAAYATGAVTLTAGQREGEA